MESHQLDFATISIHSKDIVEMIVDHGIEVTADNVKELAAFQKQHMNDKYCVLVNRVNSYSYSFDAFNHIEDLGHLIAVAVVIYDKQSEMATQAINLLPKKFDLNMQMFKDRDSALDWLHSQIESNR